ncbi:tRNA 2-thiouridine(34) synthase MnmA [Ferrimicrobium sp.]|uniref:tRNA 2-thiouridine(34) synthase MnmA n=1 Tax=Ferrimicrobium sp. TaxID=2926050 RepID=UPI002631DA05|nr:tRNA 2-thiouridine(34) synthase MnmA [Ferrimicrobium sp.]
MAKVMVAMSGGVDSSVAAALLVREGHEVVGVTLKLWGGASDSGCCSVADVEDARFVAHQLGIRHLVFNLTEEFEASVVTPYVQGYLGGETPNPCIECNRSIKFAALVDRAQALGFEYLATGHHARIGFDRGVPLIRRGMDVAKDQSYVLSVVPKSSLPSLLFPVGEMTKDDVRSIASELELRTATKPDSLEVCFISRRGGKESFLSSRGTLHSTKVVDTVTGDEYDDASPFETVTVGQRRRIGGLGDGMRRYVLAKDPEARVIHVGTIDRLQTDRLVVTNVMDYLGDGWPQEGQIQGSAHGNTVPAVLSETELAFRTPTRRIAPGQTVALYQEDLVVGSAMVAMPLRSPVYG